MNGMVSKQSCGCHQAPLSLYGGGFRPGLAGLTPGSATQGLNSQMAMMTNLMGMMMQLLQGLGGGANSLMPSQAGFGAPGAISGGGGGGLTDFLGGGSPAASGGASVAAGGGATPAVASAGEAPAAGAAGAASPVQIGAGTRVLEIGDSHTVGAFGQELDSQLRGTGAQVSTYASAGASASSFANGTGNKYGYWEKGADGSEKKVGYGTNAAPPKLESLIAKEKPHVIVVNLGANFRGGNPKGEVDKIGQIAKKHNIPLVWVGPPKTAKDNANPASIQQFDQQMAEAVAPYGKYVPSSNLTPKYSGGDGIHYGGAEGNATAKQWANGVFKAITGS